jgi:gliding motility-associated-like protein
MSVPRPDPPARQAAGIHRLIVIAACLVNFVHAQPSFSYSSPVCGSQGALYPTLSSPFPSGGNYSSIPNWLNINSLVGNITVSLSPAGTYTVIYNGGTCNCNLSTTIQILPPPVVSISNMSACIGEASVTAIAVPSTGVSYTWLPSNVHTYSNSIALPQLPQTHTVLMTDANGCIGKAVRNGTLYSPSPISINGPNSMCQGSTITLVANGAQSYTWSTGAQSNPILVSPQISTMYSVTATDSKGCKSTATKNVAVIAMAAISVNSATLCRGLSTTLTVSGSEAGVSYLWSPGGMTNDSVVVSPKTTSVYTVQVSSSGCTAKKTALVTVIDSYSAVTEFFYRGPICTNSKEPQPFLAEGFQAGGVFTSDLPIDPATGQLTINPGSEGFHQVTYSLSTEGCTIANTYSVGLTVNTPVAAQLTESVQIREGSHYQISLPDADYVFWFPPDGLSCDLCVAPVASPSATTKYCAEGVISNCWQTACITIDVLCNNTSDFSVPNAFTPNGDGNNDKFCLKGWKKCITGFSVAIYNRWGQEVYSSSNQEFCWDGTFDGQPLNSDVFVYVIKGTYNDEPEMIKKGNITLIR